MSLPAPNLDDRKFQDIVSEARGMIPRYCPEWTDHNLSDPGITLIELFAWMVDLLLYRLNKVPNKNYIKFLDLIGVNLLPAAPAKADITFRLSASQPEPVVIPRGTEVATVRTETEEAITFSTEEDLRIEVPILAHILLTHDNNLFEPHTIKPEPGEFFDAFKKKPEVDNAFYLGYNEPLGGNILRIAIDCEEKEAIGVKPEDPPYAWEFWDGDLADWSPLERQQESMAWLEQDDTRALNTRGAVVLHLPSSFIACDVYSIRAHWIRCRVIKAHPDKQVYDISPRIQGFQSTTIGGIMTTSHHATILGEVLGRSNGTSGQSFHLENIPVLPRIHGETVEVELEDGSYEQWREVSDFSESGPEDKHFTLNGNDGEIKFGPVMRQPNGEIKEFGKIPPNGRSIRFSAYHFGGGSKGNVGKSTITVLKSSIAYVDTVTNRRSAGGGVDAESIEHAKLRGPQVLRARNRAVTEDDFELLAREASPSVARAKCIQPLEAVRSDRSNDRPPPGVIRLALIPAFSVNGGMITPDQLELSRKLREQVEDYLNERRLLTTALIVESAQYVWVSVEAKVRVKPRFDARRVIYDVGRQLYNFIHPLRGGPEGNGWPFGRDLLIHEAHSCIQSVEGVDYVEDIYLYPVADPSGGWRSEAEQRVTVPLSGVVCLYGHEITQVGE